jgi:hypothetical protein
MSVRPGRDGQPSCSPDWRRESRRDEANGPKRAGLASKERNGVAGYVPPIIAIAEWNKVGLEPIENPLFNGRYMTVQDVAAL